MIIMGKIKVSRASRLLVYVLNVGVSRGDKIYKYVPWKSSKILECGNESPGILALKDIQNPY